MPDKDERFRKELAAFREPQWIDAALDRIASLPGPHAAAARLLLRSAAPLDERLAATRAADEAAPSTAMDSGETGRFLAALFGGWLPLVVPGWTIHERLPFHWGLYRRPFRAPGRDDILAFARMHWASSLLPALLPYKPQTLEWLAAWAPHLSYWHTADALGVLLGAAINGSGREGNAVYDVLEASVNGRHEVGRMGRHATRALLVGRDPRGLALVEQLLLAAQRQEGLRQTIIETADEASEEGFIRLLQVINEHDLARFAAVVRGFNVWTSYNLDSGAGGAVRERIQLLLVYFHDGKALDAALRGADPEARFLAAWVLAFRDAPSLVPQLAGWLDSKSPQIRFVATHLLAEIGLAECRALLRHALADSDLRVVMRAVQRWSTPFIDPTSGLPDKRDFESLAKLMTTLPARPVVQEPIVWPWAQYRAGRDLVGPALVATVGERPPTSLLPYLDSLDATTRGTVARHLVNQTTWDATTRKALVTLAGDPSEFVRAAVLGPMARYEWNETETVRLEDLLRRKPSDLRSGVLRLIASQPESSSRASARRLAASKDALQRSAGEELLALLAGESVSTQATLDDALGLAPPAQRTWPPEPRRHSVRTGSAAAGRVVESLRRLVQEQAATIVRVSRHDGSTIDMPFGSIYLPPAGSDRTQLPLVDVWDEWFAGRPASERDADGFEIPRALLSMREKVSAEREDWLVVGLLEWLLALHAPADAATFLLDVIEDASARIDRKLLSVTAVELDQWYKGRNFFGRAQPPALSWRGSQHQRTPFNDLLSLATRFARSNPAGWSVEESARLWLLWRWVDEPLRPPSVGGPALSLDMRPLPRQRAPLEVVMRARQLGAATDADILDHLVGDHEYFEELRSATNSRWSAIGKWPELAPLVERVRQRILEIELRRGEAPTAASKPALALGSTHGFATVVGVMQLLGKRPFRRGYIYDTGIDSVCSHLARRCLPDDGDTAEAFAAAARDAGLREKRLVEMAVFAPQWAAIVEQVVDWPALTEAIWWIHAHTKSADWFIDPAIRDRWQGDMSTRTSLTGDELLDGAVDVAWFHRVHTALDPERWKIVYEAAKYASSGAGHTRARLFADAMLRHVAAADLIQRISAKRHQDSVRALGLVPLGKNQQEEVLSRYHVIQQFARDSRQFGAQRQVSEKRAAQIALDNLARTAGYADPIRLQWAMEARAIADFADGPVTLSRGGVDLSLAITPAGEVALTMTRDGKTLSTLPAALKNDPGVKELRNRRDDVKRQAARVRSSLEQLMTRGDQIESGELRELMGHALLGPMLANLVLVGDGIAGFPIREGQALHGSDGAEQAVGKREQLRIAHPIDLMPAKTWSAWQRICFAQERVQPFKQVFRELYVPTAAERAASGASQRYAGHQLEPRRAIALLGTRGWILHPDEGIRKTWHDEGLVSWLDFEGGFSTPAEVDGLTIASVSFTRRQDSAKPFPLGDVPPRVFSEAMRDLDLVVSVAHRTGSDPEASASTIEMRAALVVQMSALLKLTTVRVEPPYVKIHGALAQYAVHLGSAVAHRLPGGMMLIVPVHSQHRGRLFLPFADDDPRTAEVLSKTLLLARDTDIKDPGILDQIRA